MESLNDRTGEEKENQLTQMATENKKNPSDFFLNAPFVI
jgi:hypothetical protein